MSFDKLKETVWRAHQGLVEAGLVILTWGNASAVDRGSGVVAIKPSGVTYNELRPEDIVVLSLETGQVIEGNKRPSSDTPTHLWLYRSFESIGGIVHTHSLHASSFAQAMREIPCLGTTHADNFGGPVPVTRPLAPEEIQRDYELNTGKVIVECLHERGIDPMQVPGVLVASHGPFAWGASAADALENAIVLETVAQMSLQTFILNPQTRPIQPALLDKHFFRKHGQKAYYGQK